jgi:pimeloyl-ACP methyl ester carboxylesterase
MKFDQLNYSSTNDDCENLVLLLHGNSTDKSFFNDLFPSINDWHIVAPDIIGHGKSPRLDKDDYSVENMIGSIVALIKEFNYEKIVVIGHSLGGNLATELIPFVAIDGILLMASPPLSYTVNMLPYNQLPEMEWSADATENAKRINVLSNELTNHPKAAAVLKMGLSQTDPLYREKLGEELAAGKFQDQLQLLQEAQLIKGYINGQNDTLINQEYAIYLKSNDVFDFFYEIEGSGHYPLLENTNKTIDCIKDFLSNC